MTVKLTSRELEWISDALYRTGDELDRHPATRIRGLHLSALASRLLVIAAQKGAVSGVSEETK